MKTYTATQIALMQFPIDTCYFRSAFAIDFDYDAWQVWA